MKRLFALMAGALISGCFAPSALDAYSVWDAKEIRSGTHFLTPETQALHADAFANPGFLWVDRGAALFEQPISDRPACVTCHEGGLKGVAATYPKIDPVSGQLFNLEGRINQCRVTHQKAAPLTYESDDLLALSAFVANQSLGDPIRVDITGDAAKHVQQGRDYFTTRRGQFNLSCQQCHTQHWGQKLRGDTISQGHGNGFPAYRFEWQSLGSLHRRLRDCDTGVRAQPLPYGDPTYIAVELFLAARAQGLDMESPAVRR